MQGTFIRSKEVNERISTGDLEVDSIVSRQNSSAIQKYNR